MKKDRKQKVKEKLQKEREKVVQLKQNKYPWQKIVDKEKPRRPIRREEFYAAQRLRDAEIKIQLQHNMEILKALEEEYDAEEERKKEFLKESSDFSPE